MGKRKLKRQLGLAQIVMLGTAGTLGAQIFVLTGHAAGKAGPAAVLALLIAGLLSYSVALNYCELATAYPVAGGAMSYVREAYGNGLLSYLVGSMDCLSSTFYAALSAVGFAYSLQVFVPTLPIVPVAIAFVGVFVLLNIAGVTRVGNVQVVLGAILLTGFTVFVAAGLTRPGGFQWPVFMAGRTVLAGRPVWGNLSRILGTVALVYSAYVGFEVIADDAEEVSNPSRTIPRGILISLTLVTVVNILVASVTLGVVPWQQLAGSETALTDAVRRFIPGWGVPLMAFVGIIATITALNSAMLSATREAFTLSRDGVWPHPLSKLSRFRTPYVAILAIGAITALVAAIGVVDFLSYISSSGYLFVLFWASLSMVRLRRLRPNIERPFKVPLFPLTAYLAGASCLVIIANAEVRALAFGAGVLLLATVARYLTPPLSRWLTERLRGAEPANDRILVAAANPQTVRSLLRLASIIAQASEDAYVCVLTVAPAGAKRSTASPRIPQKPALKRIVSEVRDLNVALYTKARSGPSVSQGILDEIASHSNVRLLMLGWPGPLGTASLPENPVKIAIQKAPTNVAVLLDHGLKAARRILVPVGGGPHSRLAIELAHEIGAAEGACITALRVLAGAAESEEIEDTTLLLSEIIEEVLGKEPDCFERKVIQAGSVPEGVLAEVRREPYDLIIMGASEEWALGTRLFGSVDDWVADHAPCSVMLCRRYEPVAIRWLRRQVKRIQGEYNGGNGTPEEQPF